MDNFTPLKINKKKSFNFLLLVNLFIVFLIIIIGLLIYDEKKLIINTKKANENIDVFNSQQISNDTSTLTQTQPIITNSSTSTKTSTSTNTLTATNNPTETPTLSNTPTNTPLITNTPTPTEIILVQATSTPTSFQPTNTSAPPVTADQRPKFIYLIPLLLVSLGLLL